MSKKTTFNLDWVDPNINPQWSKWLRRDNNPYRAACVICSKTFSLSNMGKQAVTSHETSVKHLKIINSSSQNLTSFFKKSIPLRAEGTAIATAVNEASGPVKEEASVCEEPQSSMINYLTKDDVLRAEITWAIKLVMSHSSFNSFKDAAEVFKLMFPDSKIAKKVSLSRTKMTYLVAFGLAPFFDQCLKKEIAQCSKFVICFDEALNRVSQKGQMDLVIRFWNSSTNQVHSRYLNSVFLGHSTAKDLVNKFHEGVIGIPINKLIQISMDGPNVNHKFLKIVIEEEEEKGHSIFDLGTCELHIIHGAFRTGHKFSGWALNALFKAMFQLFKDSPARRADFIAITGSPIFPIKFCQVRWIENVTVAERVLKIFPALKMYIEKTTLPKTATAETIRLACQDKLIPAKIAFFSSVASLLQPFLTMFQTANPMAPFLYDATVDLVQQLMKRCVKSELMEAALTPHKFLRIDLTDKANWCKNLEIGVGIVAGRYLSKSGVSETEKRNFRRECQIFLVETAKKIVERSPLNFPIVKCISSLNPKFIISNVSLCKVRMGTLLEILNEKGHLQSIAADRAKQQFDTICYRATTEWKNAFQSYSRADRLDDFYSSLLSKDEELKDAWEVIKTVLVFSHGNATVESGFSINKDMLVENLHEKSLVALRTVYDAVKSMGGISSISFSKEMINHVKMARTRYHLALEEQHRFASDEKRKGNEKRKITDEIKVLRQKKAKLSFDIAAETKKIEFEIAELSKHLTK